MLTDRRTWLQEYFDLNEPGWVAVKPAPGDPADLCVFQNPGEYKKARARLPQKWFDDNAWHLIEPEIRRALSQAVAER